MIKKSAAFLLVASLAVACSEGENTETMETTGTQETTIEEPATEPEAEVEMNMETENTETTDTVIINTETPEAEVGIEAN